MGELTTDEINVIRKSGGNSSGYITLEDFRTMLDDKDAPPPQPVGAPPPETVDACRAHVNEARQWRRALSHAEALHARRLKNWWWICFTLQEQAILDSYDNDELRRQANEATRLAGWGRIKNSDGSWTDLKRHDGGIVRKLLRPAPPPVGGILL